MLRTSLLPGFHVRSLTLKALFSFAACAAMLSVTAESADSKAGASAKNRCFDVNQARDKYVLDERRLLVWTRTTPYLIVLGRPIPELTQGHNSIGFIDGNHDGEICANLRDGIYLEDTLIPKATNVVRLVRLNDAQVKSLEHTFKKSLQRRPRGLWNKRPANTPDNMDSRGN
jgi:hypothetical protein